MEVQISPAASFNAADLNMLLESASKAFEPTAKRLKSDLTFHCIVCSHVYGDLTSMYEHMRAEHPELYQQDTEQMKLNGDFENADENCQFDLDHELSDEEYTDLSRLLEPICELRQIDDDEDDITFENGNAFGKQFKQMIENCSTTDEALRLQLQLQLQLQNRLLQFQMNNQKSTKPPKDKLSNNGVIPFTLRKFHKTNKSNLKPKLN